jgi:hypothetical protein
MVNIHAHIGFSQFFDRNLKELRSPLPLTIFDTKWQAAALSYQAQPRTKSTSSLGNNMRYSRLPYQSEWTLSYVAWEKMYRWFIQTLRDVYHHGGFVVWLMQHKEHADRLQTQHCFMVALRYDIGVRSNAFSHHMTKNGSDYVSNIGIFRKDIADLSKATAVNFEEMVFQDNPYSPGGIRESWDPVTGKPKGKKNSNENFELSGGNSQWFSGRGRGRGNHFNHHPCPDQGPANYHAMNVEGGLSDNYYY